MSGRPHRGGHGHGGGHGGGGGGHGGGASSERWLLTYADLITLMMVFFIVLYAMSQVDKQKFNAVARALSQAFGGGNLIVTTGVGAGDGMNVPMPKELEARLAKEGVDTKDVKELLEGVGKLLAREFAQDGRFTVALAERGLILSLAGSAAFDSGKAELKPAFLPLLDAIAAELGALDNDLSIEGHTDSDPIRTGQFPSNWELSQARANVVRQYLQTKGIAQKRLIVVGYGETRPSYSNATSVGKAKNRRVDVVVLKNKQLVEKGKEISPGKQ